MQMILGGCSVSPGTLLGLVEQAGRRGGYEREWSPCVLFTKTERWADYYLVFFGDSARNRRIVFGPVRQYEDVSIADEMKSVEVRYADNDALNPLYCLRDVPFSVAVEHDFYRMQCILRDTILEMTRVRLVAIADLGDP